MSINPPIGSSPTIVGGDGMGAEADQTCVGRPGLGTGMGMYGRRARNKTWDRYIYIVIYIYVYYQTWVGSGMWIFAWLARFALLGWVTGAGWGIYQF